VSTSVPDLPDMPAGAPVPAGSLDPDFLFDASSLAGVLALVTSPSATGMAFDVGGQSAPLQGFAFGAPSGASLPADSSSGWSSLARWPMRSSSRPVTAGPGPRR